MKFHSKTPSKNLGKLMKIGGTAPGHQIPHHQEGREDRVARNDNIVNNRETRIGEELALLDTDSFERILKNVASSKTDLLKSVPSGVDPELVSIMGLIDDAKERLNAEKEHNYTTSTKAPVKFDEVIEFIDDGAEEFVIEKPPVVPVKKLFHSNNVKSPVCGNPITDYDKINEINGFDGDNHIKNVDQDMQFLVDVGQPVSEAIAQDKVIDDVDVEKVRKCQKNFRCDEKEQLDFLKGRGLHEFGKFENILGPVSRGEFASFNQNMSPTISCELGMLNPVSVGNLPIFQTCTPNGRLLPAVPRKYCTQSNSPPIKHRPTPQRAPVTIMLQSNAPSLLTTTLTESYVPNIYSPPPSSTVSSPPSIESPGVHAETSSQKKRIKLKAKKAAAAAAAAMASLNGVALVDEMNSSVDDNDKQDKEYLLDDEEKENKANVCLTDEEKEARRLKNRKNREKKARRRAEEKKEQDAILAADTEQHQKILPVEALQNNGGNQNNSRKSQIQRIGSPSQEEPAKSQNTYSNGRRANIVGAGGKNKKIEKGVSSEYTVKENGIKIKTGDPEDDLELPGTHKGVGTSSLEDILKDLGINDVSEKPNKNLGKKKKANNKKNKQQQKKEQQSQKDIVKSPPSDKAPITVDNESDNNESNLKEESKMDETAVAASITKRCSSGVGQSEEDDDQSYVSAQENLGGSNSRLSTPPAEFVDARQSRDDIVDNVMLDPNNYRDDEDVDSLARQLQKEEDEFITVGKNKKKNKKDVSVQDNNTSAPSTASSSPPNRHIQSTTGPSSSIIQSQHLPQQRNNNRPVAHPPTLGDFLESTRKETHKNTKHKKVGSVAVPNSHKKQFSIEDVDPNSPTFVDALETSISVNTSPTFSYADVAKKSSGENTPAQEMSPVPPTGSSTGSIKKTANSPISQSENKIVSEQASLPAVVSPATSSTVAVSSGAVQLPPSTVTDAVSDISFGYEETPEDKKRREQNSPSLIAPTSQKPRNPTRMNGVDLLKSFTTDDGSGNKKDADLQEMPKNGVRECNVLAAEILTLWQARWEEYNTGSEPVVYKPSQKK